MQLDWCDFEISYDFLSFYIFTDSTPRGYKSEITYIRVSYFT